MPDRYVLIEAPVASPTKYRDMVQQVERKRKVIAKGNAKAIIKAACDAPCGVYLIDLEDVPRA